MAATDDTVKELVAQVTDLFNRLRLAGVPLGVDEYMALLQALRHGYGLSDRDALKRLCRLVWLVSLDDERVLAYHFDMAITLPLPLEERAAPTSVPASQPDAQSPQPDAPIPEPTAPPPAVPEPSAMESQRPLVDREAPPVPQTVGGFGDLYEPERAAEMAHQIEDVSTQARIAFQQTSGAEEIYRRRYQMTGDYLPISHRQLGQGWRTLRRLQRVGPNVELDVRATVQQVGRDGMIVEPVLRPRRVNQAAMLLLLDQKGSMVPFHFLCRLLKQTATASGSFGQVGIYYFNNCPPQADDSGPAGAGFYREHLLFQRERCLAPQAVSDIMAGFSGHAPDVLIFSDAGAARGTWNEERIEDTATFLYQLRALGAEQFAWLNPMPQERWAESSAASIARFAPMFHLDEAGLTRALSVLRSNLRFTLKL